MSPRDSRTPGHSRHRRRLSRRHLLGALTAVFALLAGGVATSTLLSSANATNETNPTNAPHGSAATAWPDPDGSTPVSETIKVSDTYDGKLQRVHSDGLGDGEQGEGQKPIFQLEDGATLKNVVLGKPAADGVHCMGSCTLQNIWWEDVGEDAATFKGTAKDATYVVRGGGARKAADKVFQFNGTGKLVISKFEVEDFGKLVRSCGNCTTQYPRSIIVNDVDVHAPGMEIIGVNANYGDTAALRNIRIHGDESRKLTPCSRYKGNDTGDAPEREGSGPDGTHCRYSDADLSYE